MGCPDSESGNPESRVRAPEKKSVAHIRVICSGVTSSREYLVYWVSTCLFVFNKHSPMEKKKKLAPLSRLSYCDPPQCPCVTYVMCQYAPHRPSRRERHIDDRTGREVQILPSRWSASARMSSVRAGFYQHHRVSSPCLRRLSAPRPQRSPTISSFERMQR